MMSSTIPACFNCNKRFDLVPLDGVAEEAVCGDCLDAIIVTYMKKEA